MAAGRPESFCLFFCTAAPEQEKQKGSESKARLPALQRGIAPRAHPQAGGHLFLREAQPVPCFQKLTAKVMFHGGLQ